MAATGETLSIRIPPESRAALDRAAKATRRSRSFLVKEALDLHLRDVVAAHSAPPPKGRLALLMKLKGIGRNYGGLRSAGEIDASIREMRSDD